jgi:hypothetical protein
VPLILVPFPDEAYGRARYLPAESWLGPPRPEEADPDEAARHVTRRYLAAFGPASVRDIATWSGLTGVREIVERLRAGLRTFGDERGAELFDVPEAPLADPDTPAPVRFLPEYDNVFLSHADRSRIVDPADRPRFGSQDGRSFAIVLVGGFIRAVWRRENGAVVVTPVRRLSKKDAASVGAEGRRLARFLGGGDVRILPA